MFERVIKLTDSFTAKAVAEEKSGQHILRKLDEKNIFERIISAINGNGKVYSQGIAYVGAFIGADGTPLIDYVKTLDESKINFCGSITQEQLEAADFPYESEAVAKINILEYLIGYYGSEKNRQRFNHNEVTEIVSTLIKKGASFDIETYEKAKSLHINLVEIFLGDLQALSVKDIISAKKDTVESRTFEAIIFNAYLTKPIEDIFPAALTSINQAPYKNLFIKALSERANWTNASLAKEEEKETAMSSDLTVSRLPSAILKDAEVSKEIKKLEGELELLVSALDAAYINVKFDELLKADHELFMLLSKREELEAEIVKINEMIVENSKSLNSSKAISKANRENLEKQKEEFKAKWDGRAELSTQEFITQKAEAETIKRNQESYNHSLTTIESIQRTLSTSKEALEQQKEALDKLNEKIAGTDKEAKEIANQYNQLVAAREKKRNYKPQEYKVDGMKISDFGEVEQFHGFLNGKLVSIQQKGVLLTKCLEGQRFEHIYPLLSCGIILDTSKQGVKQEDLLTLCAKQFTSSSSPTAILLMAHMSEDFMNSIKTDSGLASNNHFKYFNQNVAFKYLRDENAEEAAKGK